MGLLRWLGLVSGLGRRRDAAATEARREERIERLMQVGKARSVIAGRIQELEPKLAKYKQLAARARAQGIADLEPLHRAALSAALGRLQMLRKQDLILETSMEIKEQMEGDRGFAEAMKAINDALGAGFRSYGLGEMQLDFGEAMARAQGVTEQMGVVLDSLTSSIVSSDPGETALTDEEFKRMVDQELGAEEQGEREGRSQDAPRAVEGLEAE